LNFDSRLRRRDFGAGVLRRSRELAVGFKAHDVVHPVEEGGATRFGVVGFVNGLVGIGGSGLGGSIAVFLQVQGFFADARDGGEKTQVDVGIGLGVGNGEFGEEFAHAEGGELEA
jgi:hypothetical protein